MNGNSNHTVLVLAAALGAAVAVAAAAPAAAQSSFSFGVTVGNGGYYSPYYGDHYRYGDYYPYSRAANRACRRDPWCSGSYYDRWRGPVFAPAPIYAPPAVAYERQDRYDPLPQWREAVPLQDQRRYEAPPAYRYEDARTYDPSPRDGSGDAPLTSDGALRYDLVQRGYAASDFADYGVQAARDPQYSASPVRYDRATQDAAAQSYIREQAQDPDELLLGGPE